MSHEEAPRRTGTVPRGPLRRQPPPSDPRLGWMLPIGALVVGSVAVAWILGLTETRGTAATAGATSAALASMSPTPEAVSTSIRATAPPLEPPTTGSPNVTPATVEPTADPLPTVEPTADPLPEPTREPYVGLAIDFPGDGEVVRSRVINIVGTAPPGATITRDIPLWFDEHTTVRADGIWMLPVQLTKGENPLTIRIGDDRSTEIRFTVTYHAGG